MSDRTSNLEQTQQAAQVVISVSSLSRPVCVCGAKEFPMTTDFEIQELKQQLATETTPVTQEKSA